MKKILLLCCIAFLALGMTSCTSFKVSGVQMTSQIPSYNKVGEFKTTIWVNEFLGASAGVNLFDISSDSMDTPIFDAIKREIEKYSGDAAVNVTITYKANFLQIILNTLTFNIWAPAEAEISGIVVKYNK